MGLKLKLNLTQTYERGWTFLEKVQPINSYYFKSVYLENALYRRETY